MATSAIVKRPGLEVDLSALHCALNASDPISPDSLAFFRRVAVGLGMDGRAVTPAYGLAEAKRRGHRAAAWFFRRKASERHSADDGYGRRHK